MKVFEGYRAEAYLDEGGVWTIGYGQTGTVNAGDTTNMLQAEAWLRHHVDAISKCLNSSLDVPVTQGQFDALVDFGYNCGIGALRGSSLWTKLHAGDHAGVVKEFGRWIHVKGEVSEGLVKRRAAEVIWFTSKTA
jgi:lysozyme